MKNSRLLKWLIQKWTLWNRGLPEALVPDVIVPISYMTGRHELVKATKEHFVDALKLAISINDPSRICVVHCCCYYAFNGSEEVEQRLKNRISDLICRDKDIRILEGEPMVNSVIEAMNIRKVLQCEKIEPKNMLIITSQAHARSAYYIYSRLFPNTRVFLKLFRFENEYQADHLVFDQRTPWRWITMNIFRHSILFVFGPILTKYKIW